MSYTSPIIPSGSDQRFIDVDFNREADDTGNLCGMIYDVRDEDMCAAFDGTDLMIPRAEWPDRIAKIDAGGGWLERRIRKIKAQKSEPSCVYNAGAQGLEIMWNVQFDDQNWIELSPISGYRYNGSRWSGSSVPGCLDWLLETGLIPTDSDANKAHITAGHFAHVHPNTGYGINPPSGWKESAKHFRVQEFLRLKSVEAWFSALLRGFVCIGGRDGHCIVHTRPIMDGKSFLSMYANSWGAWGTTKPISPLSGDAKGFGFDSERKVGVMTARGAWAIRSILVPPWLQGS